VKKLAFCAAITVLTLVLSPQIAAAEDLHSENGDGKIFLQFNQGVTAAWLTRIINQSGRSNFVFRDFLSGLYFDAELHNVKYITPAARAALYYPLVSTFNYVPQKPTTPLHFGADLFLGLRFEKEVHRLIRLNACPGLHLFFLNADRWNYLNMGVGVFAGMEFMLNPQWSLLVDGFASLDNGNLGTNRRMEPFDIVYQYRVDFGFRYSKRRSIL